MDLRGRSVAFYGRFSSGTRERLRSAVIQRKGSIARDLTRRSDALVVGALATSLIDNGRLGERLHKAFARGVPVFGERAFAAMLSGEEAEAATLPLSTALAPVSLDVDDARLLAAFDLIVLAGHKCRFADATVLRSAGELAKGTPSRAELVRILVRVRDAAPAGRRKLVITRQGDAALAWDDGLTNIEGQGLLPLDVRQLNADELFEQAELAEASGNVDEAARLYDTCSTADRDDPIAPYNRGNILLAQEKAADALQAYQRALMRDPDFPEARYNMALALESLGRPTQARAELNEVLRREPDYEDAVFNLAQMLLKEGNVREAKTLYERYLALDPPSAWAVTARKAILYCSALLTD